MPPCGGAPYCRASSRKPNFSFCAAGVDAQQREDLLLHVHAVDTDAAAADLAAVDDDVVRLALDRLDRRAVAGAVELGQVGVQRRGERVVRAGEALLLLVVLEQREVHHPHPGELGRRRQLQVAGHLQPQLAEHLVNDLGLVGGEAEQIALLGAVRSISLAAMGWRNLATPVSSAPPAVTLVTASPLAPNPLDHSARASVSLRVIFAPPGTTIALTIGADLEDAELGRRAPGR